MTTQFERLKVLSAGILSLILMLGIARFAYTPMLPVMQSQAGLGISEGGWLAAINYMGYLCGAIIAALSSDLILKDRLYRIGLVMAVITTVGMGVTDNLVLWAVFRFLAGLSSAAGLLLASGLIMNWLIRNDFRSELGIHFSGLGLGIAFCSFTVLISSDSLDWREQWYLLTAAGILLMIPAWRWLPPPDRSAISRSGKSMHDNAPGKGFQRLLMAAYFCAGVGYVVSATFIVAIVDSFEELSGMGYWTFMLLGLAAAPACIFWDLVARRVGDYNALLMAYVVQIVSILLPVFLPSAAITLLGAFLFGATFIGIVSLVLSIAGRYYPTRPAKMMGKMTIAYGVAQIIGPAITGMLAEQSGSYADGLYMAATMMIVGTLIMLRLRILDHRIRAGNSLT